MKRNWNALVASVVLATGMAGCMSSEPEGIAPSQPANVTVKMDFWQSPTPGGTASQRYCDSVRRELGDPTADQCIHGCANGTRIPCEDAHR